jgi:diketogulonate reductase-like aldo/keto reductase
LDKLKLDYLDLYLIHWPVRDRYIETWDAFQELYERKHVRAIGVSNFHKHHLEDLLKRKGWTPMVNQVEFHPYLNQRDLRRFCRENDIQYEAWSPILKGKVNDIPEIRKIASKYGKNPVQVTLRWDLQKRVVTIPKSVQKERIESNADIFDFELTKDEIKAIDTLDRNERIGPNPNSFNF